MTMRAKVASPLMQTAKDVSHTKGEWFGPIERSRLDRKPTLNHRIEYLDQVVFQRSCRLIPHFHLPRLMQEMEGWSRLF